MITLPDHLSESDINQWLRGGYFFVQGADGSYDVASLRRATAGRAYEEGRNCSVEVDLLGGDACVVRTRDIFPHWPLCGSLNVPDHLSGDGVSHRYAVVLDRVPRQQYRRTYNYRCLSVVVPRAWAVRKGGYILPEGGSDPFVVAAAFNPVYYSFGEAQDLIEDDEAVSLAVNRYIILAKRDKGGLLVYYKGGLVGRIDGSVFMCHTNFADRAYRLLKVFGEGVTSVTKY